MKIPCLFPLVTLLSSGCLIGSESPRALSSVEERNPTLASRPNPNVLLIAVDDLNDWIGVLGGHPQARTPNIDRLAKRGMIFANAHCQSPVCNPSRASLMSGLYPETSGIYFLSPPPSDSPLIMKQKFMSQRFQDEGYFVTGAGKIFHNGENQNEIYIPNYGGQFGDFGPYPAEKISPFPGHPLWDWGVFPERDEQMPDDMIAQWAVERLRTTLHQPQFLAVGFYRPHVPQYAPQKWFDLFPAESVQLPVVTPGDLSDISTYARNLTSLHHVSPTQEWVVEKDQWTPLVQSYLASVSFVDAQVGKVLDAFDESEIAEDTYIVLFSDHGFHLGEKEHWAKRSLWEDGTRVPLIIVGPGIEAGQVCYKPVELIDLYPTLLELTGLEADPSLEGNSLKSLLDDEEADWPYMARTSFGPGNVAIRSERYRYIRYNDGSEEFYDHQTDPHEWRNLAGDPSWAAAIEEHRNHLPKVYHALLGEGSTGHEAYRAAEAARNRRPSDLP